MKRLDTLKLRVLGPSVALAAMMFVVADATAQCTTWVNPTDSTGWSDFNTTFGGAPCDDGSGCPLNEITAFEIYADEAYAMDDVAMGGTYTFSACNGAGGPGTGGMAWTIEFTIVAPSGAIDASGLDAGSNCALTWTASEAGTYLIVVSETGACGTSTNNATDNGYPAITCTSSPATACPPPGPCTTWVNPSPTTGWSDFNTTFMGAPCDDGSGCPFNEITAFEIYADEAYAMDNVAMGGMYTFSVCNGAGGAGTGGSTWNVEFTVIAPSGAVDASGLDSGSNCELTWTASEDGTYLIVVSEAGACGISMNNSTDNGYPAITCVSGPATMCTNISVQELTDEELLNIRPNPSSGEFNIAIAANATSIEVMDLNGRLVQGASVVANGVNNYMLDLSGHDAGTYIVRTEVEGRIISERISLVK